jgi:hypothetical protein
VDSRFLKHGLPVRLFPIFPESAREQRSLSIMLAAMTSVRPFADKILSPLGVRLGKRATLSCYTEVTLANEVKGVRDRPDALIVLDSGKTTWTALVEAKVGKSVVEDEQLERYIELARANGINAIITITNELTPAPTINPAQPRKTLPKNLELYHLSWSSILTQAFLLVSSKESPFDNDDEAFIASELVRYLEDQNSGRLPLDQMNKEWPKIVSDVQAGHPINAKLPEVSEMVATWHQEARDVALIMTRKLKEPVSLTISRAQIADPRSWIDGEIKAFCDSKALSFELDVPNAASRITVRADFLRRSIAVCMKVGAPLDKAGNGARLNWVLRQLQRSDLSKVTIRCITRGKGFNYGATANEIDPKSDELKALTEIVSFEIETSADLSARFNSRKKFVESLEELVPAFYANVGQYVQAWVPPPPQVKHIKPAEKEDAGTVGSLMDEKAVIERQQSAFIEAANKTPMDRPDWANYWRVSADDAESKDASTTP